MHLQSSHNSHFCAWHALLCCSQHPCVPPKCAATCRTETLDVIAWWMRSTHVEVSQSAARPMLRCGALHTHTHPHPLTILIVLSHYLIPHVDRIPISPPFRNACVCVCVCAGVRTTRAVHFPRACVCHICRIMRIVYGLHVSLFMRQWQCRICAPAAKSDFN